MRVNKIIFFFILLLFVSFKGAAQMMTGFKGINYQAILRNSDGTNLSVTFPFSIRFSLTGPPSAQLYYQETQSVSQLNNGLFDLVIGNGTVTGASLFSSIDGIYPFKDGLTLKVEIDLNSSGYLMFEQRVLKSAPFALFSLYSLDTLNTSGLSDVMSSPVSGSVLKWNGLNWISSNDLFASDTAAYGVSSSNSLLADSAGFAGVSVNIIHVDSVLYSFSAPAAVSADNSSNANTAATAGFAGSVNSADSVLYVWHLKGNRNLSPFYLGSTDTSMLKFKTNNIERLRLNKAGNVYIGSGSSPADLVINANNGFLFSAFTPQSSWNISSTSTDSKFLFSADSSSFRGGTISSTAAGSIGYSWSFAFGRDAMAKGRSSIAIGDSCQIFPITPPAGYNQDYTDGNSSFAFGKNCNAHGRMSIAVGYRCQSLMFRGVAMGYQCTTNLNSANIALGYKATAWGSTAASIGYNTLASGHKSTALGSNASTNGKDGSFVYGDASGTDTVKNSAPNQFMIRASGGIRFYTDTFLLSGVEVFPGSGAWSSLSDSLKKNNFSLLNDHSYFNEFNELNIYYWNYKSQQSSIKHIGPTAQSFKRLFNLGENNTSINLVDADGITMHMVKSVLSNLNNYEKIFEEGLPELKTEVNVLSYDELNEQLNKILKNAKSFEND